MATGQNADGTYDDSGPDLGGLLGAVLGKETDSTTQSNQTTQGSTAQTTVGAGATTNQQNTTGQTNTNQNVTGQTQTQGTQTNTGTQQTTGTVRRENDTTQQTQNTTQQTADTAGLQEVLSRQLAGISPEQLASIFEIGSRAAPQLIQNQAGALGARVGNNTPLAASLRELQSNLIAKAADINAKMLSDAGGTAAQIAQATKTIESSGTNLSSSVGQDVQDLLTATTNTQQTSNLQNTMNQTVGSTDTTQNTTGASTTQNTQSTEGTQTQGVQATEVKNSQSTVNSNVVNKLVGAFAGGVALDQIFRSATGQGFTGTIVDLAKNLIGNGAKLNDVNAQLKAAGFPPITQQQALDYLQNQDAPDLPPYEYPLPTDAPVMDIPEIDIDYDNGFIDFGGFFANGGMPGRKKVGYADGGMPAAPEAKFLPMEPLIKKPVEAVAAGDSGDGDLAQLLAMFGGGSGLTNPTRKASTAVGTPVAPGDPDGGPGGTVGSGGIATPGSVPTGAISTMMGFVSNVMGLPPPIAALLSQVVAPLLAQTLSGGAGSSGATGSSAAATAGGDAAPAGVGIGEGVPGTVGTGDAVGTVGDGGSGSSSGGGDGVGTDGGTGGYADGGRIEPRIGSRSPLPQGEGGGGLSRQAVRDFHKLMPVDPAASAPLRFEKGFIPHVEKKLRDSGAYADGGMITNLNGDDWSAPTEATGGADDEYHQRIMGALGITRSAGGLQLSKNAVNMFNSVINKSPATKKAPSVDAPAGYASGGEIKGPGTGTSDSIPAVASGREMIRISDGEYIIPADVVNKFGADAFDELVQQFHTPVRTA